MLAAGRKAGGKTAEIDEELKLAKKADDMSLLGKKLSTCISVRARVALVDAERSCPAPNRVQEGRLWQGQGQEAQDKEGLQEGQGQVEQEDQEVQGRGPALVRPVAFAKVTWLSVARQEGQGQEAQDKEGLQEGQGQVEQEDQEVQGLGPRASASGRVRHRDDLVVVERSSARARARSPRPRRLARRPRASGTRRPRSARSRPPR